MCAIAGILRRAAGADDLPRVRAMIAAQAHRGPDGEGFWVSASQQATFGAARLAILDLSAAAAQPMTSADGRYAVVFNGEIYNYRALRRELAADWQSDSDTEVLIAAYRRYGSGCVDRLRGMFAFAIWDEHERSCFLARDRFGIKPLYYRASEDACVFASEVRAMAASGLVSPALDPAALYGYFRSGSVPEPRSLLRDVRLLEAGHTATWNDGRFASRQYWDISFGTTAPGDSRDIVSTALADSVRHHYLSDVPVGVFLSGGIDSTALVATAASAGVGHLRTLTLSMPDAPGDETARARKTAAQFGACHTDCVVDATTAKRLLPAYLQAIDQPSIDGLNTFAVCRVARERGLKVVLSGIGADELFGGYKSFREVPRLTAASRLVRTAGLQRAAEDVLMHASDPRHRRLADLFNQPLSLGAAYSVYRGIFSRAESSALVERYTGLAGVRPEDVSERAGDPTDGDTVSRLELSRYVRNQLLRDADVMGMACGVEVRTPFLDAAMVDAATSLPAAARLAAGKQALAQAIPNMPAGIVHRSKRVFQFPFDDWIGGEWREVFSGFDSASPIPTGPWYRKWCVMTLDHWIDRVGNEV
jgi:asparagine synthase (glutamine-hydrolysing)